MSSIHFCARGCHCWGCMKEKLHSQTLSSDLIDFFSVESDCEGPRSNFEREDGQTDSEKNGTCERLWCQRCHLAFMLCHASDPKCSWSARISSYASRRSEPITSGQIQNHAAASNSWHQQRNIGRVIVTRDLKAISGRLFDRVPVRILTSDFHHRTQRKKAFQDLRLWCWTPACNMAKLFATLHIFGMFTQWSNNTIMKCHSVVQCTLVLAQHLANLVCTSQSTKRRHGDG